MSAKQAVQPALARLAVTAAAAAVAALAGIGPAAALSAGHPAGPARPAVMARAAGAAVTPGEQIAAALRTSPLYIDPSLASAFNAAARAQLLRQIHAMPVPTYIIAVPLLTGGQWGNGQQLATVVHNYLGGPGIYLTPDIETSGDIDAYTWPSDPQGIDAGPYHADDAAQAADLDQSLYNAPLTQKFLRCMALIRSGQAVSAYQAATRNLSSPAPPAQPAHGGGAGGVLIAVIAVAAAGVAAGALLVIGRRRRRPSSFVTPRSVFVAARTATEAELRSQAQQQVIELGELVEQPGPLATAEPATGPRSEQERELVASALDAYQAAGKVLDSAAGICDLAGVLVLTHLGRNAAAAALALKARHPAPAGRELCFFNPLHGQSVRQVRWRALGGRESLDVSACQECAAAVEHHRLPEVLTDRRDGEAIPYYEADPRHSVWAATGYGQFGTDLVQRILTQGAHPAR